MIYLAASMWLLFAVLLAWGVHHLWCGLFRPRVVNGVLLPATVLAQVGYIMGLLITGTSARNVSLVGDDGPEPADGDPSAGPPPAPLLASVVLALLPLIGLAAGTELTCRALGEPLVGRVSASHLASQPPLTLPAFWEQLRHLVTLAEETVEAVRGLEWTAWPTGALLYVLLCLVVRAAPLRGNFRGQGGAIVVAGIAGALAGTVLPEFPETIAAYWPTLTVAVGLLLVVLMLSLIARGIVGVYHILNT